VLFSVHPHAYMRIEVYLSTSLVMMRILHQCWCWSYYCSTKLYGSHDCRM